MVHWSWIITTAVVFFVTGFCWAAHQAAVLHKKEVERLKKEAAK